MKKIALLALIALITVPTACEKDKNGNDNSPYTVNNPDTAPEAEIDRFSDMAAMLFRRSGNNSLPGPNQAINFDQSPFITKGLGPSGEKVEYYNFDVQPTDPAPIYVLFREGESTPVSGQLNIINVIPGDAGYNDFWHVHKVTVPAGYVANTASSMQDIQERGFAIESTDILVNCPVVPEGSTANKRLGGGMAGLVRGWYRDQVVYYFNFEEKALQITADNMVPLSPIYVTFNVNPDSGNPNSGPPSGFVTETGSAQTHNVIATLPSHGSYSPLWMVNVYDNADFDMITDLNSATSANILATGVANVNCPVVSVQ